MKALIGITIVALVALGSAHDAHAQRSRRSQPPPEPAATVVNGRRIPLSLYRQWYNDQLVYQAKMGMGSAMNPAVDDSIILRLVDNELVRQEAEKRRIAVSRIDARSVLLANPPDFIKAPFVDPQGRFREDVFREVILHPEKIVLLMRPGSNRDSVIASWKRDLDQVITFIQSEEIRRKLGDALLKERPLTPSQIRNRYIAERTRFTGSFIRVLHSTVPDTTVQVSEEEARAWYDSHVEDYRFAAARQLASLIIPVLPLAQDSAELRERISTARSLVTSAPLSDRSRVVTDMLRALPPNRIPDEEPTSLLRLPEVAREATRRARPGDLVGPFSVNGEEIMLYIDDTVTTRDTVIRARHILMKIAEGDTSEERDIFGLMTAMKEKIPDEKTFQQGVQFYSQDVSARDGGDLGYFGRGNSVRPFDSASFSAPLGQVVGPVRTQFGYHLIWVNDRTSTAYRIRELRFQLEPSASAREAARVDANAYAVALRNGTVTDSMFFELKGRYRGSVSDTSVLRRLDVYGDVLAPVNFAFSAEMGDVAVIPLPYDRVMVTKIIFSHPTGVAPYDAIRLNYVHQHVRRSKQLDLLEPVMKQLRDSLTPDMTVGIIRLIAPMAESFMVRNETMQAPPDEDPMILDSLLAATPDKGVSGPVRGTHGYYFVRVESRRVTPTDADFARERDSFTRDFTNRYRAELVEKLMKKAREYAVVEDLRPGAVPTAVTGANRQ